MQDQIKIQRVSAGFLKQDIWEAYAFCKMVTTALLRKMTVQRRKIVWLKIKFLSVKEKKKN